MLDANKDFEDRTLTISEDAIDKAINYLKFHDPSNTNCDYAIGLLQRMQVAAKISADSSKMSFGDFVERSNQSLKNKKD